MKLARLVLTILIAWILAPYSGKADSYPSHPIKLIVPLGAGGSVDILARSIAADLSKRLGQSIIIENRPGGGTLIGAADVARAPPDGYTLLAAPSGTLTIEVALHKSLPYDPIKDFIPLARYVNVPCALVVNSSLPVKSVSELIAYVKKRPGKISYSAATIGGVYHLTGEIFKREAGISMTPVFYREGGTAALNDVLANVVPVGFADAGVARSLLTTKKIRALGVTSSVRVPALPNVPTIAESGLPNFDVVSWHMLLAPAGTPKPVVERLRDELKVVLAQPDTRNRMQALGLLPVADPTPPVPVLRAFVASEIARWGKVVRQVGLAGKL